MTPQDLTVVIPTHNRQTQVVQAVESVLQQAPMVASVIVVCDHCEDDSALALRALGAPALVVVERSGGVRGASATRNHGVRSALTDWVMFLDDDDQLHTGAIEAVTGVMASVSDADWFWGERCWVADHGQAIKIEQFKSCLIDPATAPEPDHFSAAQAATSAGFGIRTETFKSIGGFDETLRVSEDRDLIYRLLQAGRAGQRIGRCLVDHRIHPGVRLSDARDVAATSLSEQRVIEKNLSYLSRHPGVWAMHLHRVASKQRHGGDLSAARETVRQILSVKPTDLKAWRRRLTW